ncbi:hypothetical protein [Flavisolibacter nicotianae]|uniref:hypothetical protein n=1 Tax=Flavisolibacter nicotianae TaxID=2364882 RepID=UPI000EADE4FA|nr:hypothetical protein [Flavisolibacter nicotianae]
MKSRSTPIILPFFLLTSLYAAGQAVQVKQPAGLNMRGSYTMQKQTLDSGKGLSTLNVQQDKIYTDKYIMYAHRRSETDSLAEFGIGTYKIENGQVIENMFYGSSGPVNGTYQLAITKRPDGYSQVIDFPGSDPAKHYILTEDYKNASKAMKTPLDGAWKQVRNVTISPDGKTMADDHPTQYKIYESGHYMWANTSKDSSGKLLSFYGYGTFDMPRPDEVTELTSSSTFTSALVGQPVTVKIKFLGKDSYEQTITWPDGSKLVETYERMK